MTKKQAFIELKNIILSYLKQNDFEYSTQSENGEHRIDININNIKCEYHISSNTFRCGYGIIDNYIKNVIYSALKKEFDKTEQNYNLKYKRNNKYLDLYCELSLENFILFLDTIDNLNLEIPDNQKFFINLKNIQKKGENFKNTVFENIKERGVTISPMFCKFTGLCEISGMNMNYIQAEYETEYGQIDGVELDENTFEPISIYECQSGIHNGNYLDEDHLMKILCKYLYSKKILPTLKKIVILAGGYNDDLLNIIKNRSIELSQRTNPIEIILLQTIKEKNQIKVIKKEY
jgi:hypothetical protein